MELTATNLGSQPLRLEMGDSSYSFDFVVTRPDGTEVWSRLHHAEAIPLIGSTRILSSGETITFEDQWDLRTNQGKRIDPGTYLVHGLLDADTVPYRMLRTETKSLSIGHF